MQKTFFNRNLKESMEKASEYIGYTTNLFREYNKKIIWIQDEDKEDGNVNGTEGFEIIELLSKRKNPKERQVMN